MKIKFALLLLPALLGGCAAYNSLIGHPLHVLWQEHQNVEAEQQRDVASQREASSPTNSLSNPKP